MIAVNTVRGMCFSMEKKAPPFRQQIDRKINQYRAQQIKQSINQ